MTKAFCNPRLRNLLLPMLGSLWLACSLNAAASTWRSLLYPETWTPPGQAVPFTTAKLIQDFSYAGYRRGEESISNNCEMRRPQYGGGGGNGYMVRVQSSNECLIDHCLADFSRHGFVVSHAGTSGNVFLQCEDRETQRAIGSSSSGYTTSGSGSDNHMH